MTSSNRYLIFLRGVNVGGVKVLMKDLTQALTKAGFKNVKTLLASGNVALDAEKTTPTKLKTEVEAVLKKTFQRDISVVVRSSEQIQKLIASDPFKGIKVTPDTRLYISFLPEPTVSKNLKIPYQSDDGNFQILKVTDTEIISYLIITPDRGSVDLMGILEKEYSKKITTRNWNTVVKSGKL